MTNKEFALSTMMFGYNNLSIRQGVLDDKLLSSLQKLIAKLEKKNLKIPKTISLKATNEIYKKMVNIDKEAFADKGFAPILMVIIILDYLMKECRNTTMRTLFGFYDTSKMIQEIETNMNLRKSIFEHYKVLTKLIEV